jgi:hypothetical protein
MGGPNLLNKLSPSLLLTFAGAETLDPRITFTRATTATFTGSNGLIQTAAIDAPRFDYNPTTLAPLGLLIEEQRTNLLLNTSVLETQVVTVTAAAHTLSFYGTGTIVLSGAFTGTVTGTGAYPTRTILTFTPIVGVLTVTVTGSVTSAQLETGAFPTSYIPTEASQVTRSADVAVMTGTNFSDWYNASEGTLFAEWSSVGSLSDSRIVYALSNGTFNNVNYLTAATASASNQSVNTIRSSNTTQAITAVPGAYTNYTYRKTAAVYKVNDFALSGDGSAVVVDTSGLLPVGVDRIALGTSWTAASNFINGHISQIAFYPRRLANSELQAITA